MNCHILSPEGPKDGNAIRPAGVKATTHVVLLPLRKICSNHCRPACKRDRVVTGGNDGAVFYRDIPRNGATPRG
jgi:hypothetical protein